MENSFSEDARVIGRAVPRLEDPPLLRGAGRYVDDIHRPGMLHAAFVRSDMAHARIKGIDATAATAQPGVHAVLTAEDLAPRLTQQALAVGMPSSAYKKAADRPILASDETRYVGEPIACVIADSRYLAEDAAALVSVDYDPLPVSADCVKALDPGAPPAHLEHADNLLAEFSIGYGDVDTAFRDAPHVFSDRLWHHRGCGQAIETRGLVAEWDGLRDVLNVWNATQTPHAAHKMLVKLFGLDEDQIRVSVPDVGGGFGPKLVLYSEDVAVAAASMILERPVKWIEDRREHFVATTQERDQAWELEIAVDDDGKLLGIRGNLIHDHGAYTCRGLNVVQNAALILPGNYELPAYRMDIRVALTNKVPVTPVRGAGHPQGNFAMERMLDLVATELGLDRIEVRRRNLIAGEAMPYTRPLKDRSGEYLILDSGNYPAALDEALEAAGHAGFAQRRESARGQGRYRGFGIANYIKGTGRGPFEQARVRISPSGRISVATGATAIGQGTRTMLSQVVGEIFGVAPQEIRVQTGDSAAVPLGFGATSSRETVAAGNSTHLAATKVRDKAVTIAAAMLEAAEEDMEVAEGRISVRGVPDLSVSLAEVADAISGEPGFALPADIQPGLESTDAFLVGPLTMSSGCHAAEVEVDPGTGHVRLINYVIVCDAGRIINPAIVDGQLEGGAAHGIGNALFEWMAYDETAQPVSTTLAEYLIPSATEMPNIDLRHQVSPTPFNPLGVKGVGESGTIPAPAAIVSAVEDALRDFGVRVSETPIQPQRLAEMIRDTTIKR